MLPRLSLFMFSPAHTAHAARTIIAACAASPLPQACALLRLLASRLRKWWTRRKNGVSGGGRGGGGGRRNGNERTVTATKEMYSAGNSWRL